VSAKDSTMRTIFVALAVCAVCSILVSTAAVTLRKRQQQNKLLDKRKNILIAAGMIKPGEKVSRSEIAGLFSRVKKKVINLKKGTETTAVDPAGCSQSQALADNALSYTLNPEEDIAGIKRMVKYGVIYNVYKENKIALTVFPVCGKGLWSTLYGFIALDKDLNTVRGITFYEHNETPGLGGEIDNSKWQAGWVGRKIYKEGKPVLKLIKGKAGPAREDPYQVDALSGATLTSKGVTHLIRFWFGSKGYAEYIKKHQVSPPAEDKEQL